MKDTLHRVVEGGWISGGTLARKKEEIEPDCVSALNYLARSGGVGWVSGSPSVDGRQAGGGYTHITCGSAG